MTNPSNASSSKPSTASASGSTELRFHHSLRVRVSTSFLALGAVLGSLLAVAAWIAVARMEVELIEEFLAYELADFVERIERNPSAPMPTSAHTRGFLVETGDEVHLPGYLRGLAPGRHEIVAPEGIFAVLVEDRGARRFLLVYDEGRLQIVERDFLLLLAAGVLGFSALALWIGAGASRRIIAPVGSLARRVTELSRSDEEASLAEDFGADEVGILARAFDRYAERLRAFVRREKAFVADVSHEFRTALSIINSAAELVRLDFEEAGRSSPALERLCRAALRMERLVDAFLFLAREPKDREEWNLPTRDVRSLLGELVDERRMEAEVKGLRIELDAEVPLTVEAPAVALEITVGNLLSNAIRYSEQGTVRLRVEEGAVAVEDEGLGIAEADLPHLTERAFRGEGAKRPGSGLGLAIAERFCQRFGWRLEWESREGLGTTARLHFGGA